MELSQYVFEQSDCYFNTVTVVKLPKTSSEETLRNHFFLRGQEEESVHWRLFAQPVETVGIKIIPTWRCNLRCGHCFVLHKLQKQDAQTFDVEGFLSFVDSILDTSPLNRFGISFVGGEATLEAEKCCRIWDGVAERLKKKNVTNFVSNLTTNGTNWDRASVELFARVGTIMVSVDGDSRNHNNQRHPFFEDLRKQDLYRLTLRNIKRMVLMGFGKKVTVQASLYDEGFNDEAMRNFHRDLLACGLTRERIVVGSAVPTPVNKRETDLYKRYLATYIFNRPCCTYRRGSELVVDNSGAVFADYFKDYKESVLGTITTPFPEIVEKHKQLVLDIMPVLNDEKCKTCPVLGACWGRCSNTEFLKPSDLCDQESLLNMCRKFAEKDQLVSKYLKIGEKVGENNDYQSITQSDLYTHS